MGDIFSLYEELQEQGVSFYLWDLGSDQAATISVGSGYGVFMDFDNIHSTAEEAAIVAHEGGHIMTGSLHRVGSPYEIVEQHENKADKWAVGKLVSKDKLAEAVRSGYTEIWQLAEYFDLPEDFMRKAVCWYKNGNLAVDYY